MAKLLHILEGNRVRDYELTEGELHIGRNNNNDIQMNDPEVSGSHAVIKIRPSVYMEGLYDFVLEDLNSTNGTNINGRRLAKPYMLKHKDIIQIGSHQLQFIDESTLSYETTRYFLRNAEQE
jgi:pSer/pThr/pTyr-binding forkhead associated (FHA) protein